MSNSGNLDFFAAEADQRALFDFLYSSTDVRIFESYSKFGSRLQEFKSTEELSSTYPIGYDIHGNGHAILLQLWSPSVMQQLTITRIDLSPEDCDGHTFRYRVDGGGLIQLYLGGICNEIVTRSHYGHQSQTRSQAWETHDGVNWDSLKKLSNKIQYQVRSRMAAGKAKACPVLPQAMELARSGFALKLSTQTPWAYELNH